MQILIVGIWVLQGILMFWDEFYFHHKRRLGKWESIGHPVDTFSFLACFLYPLFFTNEVTFFILAIISSLIITKDEWVHSKQCLATENWLHAVLFVVHPIALGALYFAWMNNFFEIIKIQSVIIFIFGIYQVTYWNLITNKKWTINE